MKKSLQTLLAGVLMASFLLLNPMRSSAQGYYDSSYRDKSVSMGITFSPNFTWLRYGDNDDYEGQAGLGFAYGLLTDFEVAENYYFATGLLINTLWTQGTHTPSNVKSHHRIQFLEIPLALKLKSAEQNDRSFYGKFGFSAGLRTSGRERIDDASNRTKIEGANAFRLGLQIGGGVEWELGNNLSLMTGLTFNNGFTRAMKDGEPKNSYLSLDFGIFF